MSTFNLRRELIDYPGTSIMGVTKRLYKKATVHTVLYLVNNGSEAFVEKGLGLHGVTLPVADFTATPTAYAFGNKSYFKRFYEQIKALVKDINAKKITVFDPDEYPDIATKYPDVFDAMFSGITNSTTFTATAATLGEGNDAVDVIKITATGISPKEGPFSMYGTADLTAKIGDTSKDVYCDGNDVIVVGSVTETSTITLSIPGYKPATVTITVATQSSGDDNSGTGT